MFWVVVLLVILGVGRLFEYVAIGFLILGVHGNRHKHKSSSELTQRGSGLTQLEVFSRWSTLQKLGLQFR